MENGGLNSMIIIGGSDKKWKLFVFLVGNLVQGLQFVVNAMIVNLHITGHWKPALGGHRAADGFLSKQGKPGLLELN